VGVTVGENADENIAMRGAVQHDEVDETFDQGESVGEESSKQTQSRSTQVLIS